MIALKFPLKIRDNKIVKRVKIPNKKLLFRWGQLLAMALVVGAIMQITIPLLIRYIVGVGSMIFLCIANYSQGIDDGVETANRVLDTLMKEGLVRADIDGIMNKK